MEIPTWELRAVLAAWRSFSSDDERVPHGNALLTTVDGRRRWVTGSGYTFAVVDGGDGPDASIMIPGRVVYSAGSSDTDSVELVIRSNHQITAIRAAWGDSASTMTIVHAPDPQMMAIAHQPIPPSATAAVPKHALVNTFNSASANPYPLGDRGYPLCDVVIDDGHLSVGVDWETLETAHHHLAAQIVGSGHCSAEPLMIARAANFLACADEDDVTVEIASTASHLGVDWMMTLRTERLSVVHMPPGPERNLRQHIEGLLSQTFGDLATARDHDGDYVIRRHGHQILARLVPGQMDTLQVFGVVLDDVTSSPELLKEINDINAGLSFVRVMLIENQVLAEVDLASHLLGVEELHNAAQRISHLVADLAPVIATVHGGALIDPSDARMQLYRNVVIEAETSPGAWMELHGPDATENWTLPPEVYIITAHDPSGIPMTDAANSAANRDLAAAIVRDGGSFTAALGRSPDGRHGESSFLVWNLDSGTATDLGREFGQDAIFALDATTVHLMPCIGDSRLSSWPRC